MWNWYVAWQLDFCSFVCLESCMFSSRDKSFEFVCLKNWCFIKHLICFSFMFQHLFFCKNLFSWIGSASKPLFLGPDPPLGTSRSGLNLNNIKCLDHDFKYQNKTTQTAWLSNKKSSSYVNKLMLGNALII